MFSCINDEKIFQTLPGQGWRVLIEWKLDAEDIADGQPAITLEPVIAWVTARIQRTRERDGFNYEAVIIAPLVRESYGSDLLLLDKDTPARSFKKFVYLEPGEELATGHFNQLQHGGYTHAVTDADSVMATIGGHSRSAR
jgi:hypothetical protein